MKETEHFVKSMSDGVMHIARQTVEHFGEEKAEQFSRISMDGVNIQFAIQRSYQEPDLMNLVYVQTWGLLKEFKWLQFLFYAGNYPLVKSRLRYILEAIYRAYWVETHADDDVRKRDADQKLQWIEENRLHWGNCVKPALVKVLPLLGQENEASKYYKDLWDQLNLYVHPSAYLQHRMVGESTLLLTDSFDAEWAENTLIVGQVVADLIWAAVLTCHEKAIASLKEDDMSVGYTLVSMMLQRGCVLS